jgi:hypothetical protein
MADHFRADPIAEAFSVEPQTSRKKWSRSSVSWSVGRNRSRRRASARPGRPKNAGQSRQAGPEALDFDAPVRKRRAWIILDEWKDKIAAKPTQVWMPAVAIRRDQ